MILAIIRAVIRWRVVVWLVIGRGPDAKPVRLRDRKIVG
jgi:hypothetical protein